MTREVSELVQRIESAFPVARVRYDAPRWESGTHHVDVRMGDRLVVVEWSERLGYGLSLISDTALDGGPDVRGSNIERAMAELGRLFRGTVLTSEEKTRYVEILQQSPAVIVGRQTAVEAPADLAAEDCDVEANTRQPPRTLQAA